MKPEYLYSAVLLVAKLLQLYSLFGMIDTAITYYRHETNELPATAR